MRWVFPALLALIVAAIVAGLAIWLRQRQRVVDPARIDRTLALPGSALCIDAIQILTDLAEVGNETDLATAWLRLELPLRKALPDCPPDRKLDLANALQAAMRVARRPSLARSIASMRDDLIGG